jgi:hypothetical protein
MPIFAVVKVKTTMICTHVINRGAGGVQSPADWVDTD